MERDGTRSWWVRRGSVLALAVCAAAGCGPGGCAEQPAPASHGLAGLFDNHIADVINQRPATAPAEAPEPRVIDSGERSTLVYAARHARPEVLKEAVSGLLNPDGTIQDSAALNSLVISDKREVIANVLDVLRTLDNPTPQLLVEARVVEVTLTGDLEYEIKHTLTVNSPGAFFQSSDITLATPGANPTPLQGAAINIRPWGSADVNLDNFIRLLETKGKANILSSPNVIVAPGTESSIITGEEVPIVQSTVVGGSVTNSTVFKRVGIKLRVVLQQLTTDSARVEINPEVSTVTGFSTVSNGSGAGTVSNPIISLRNVSSTVNLKDGEILTIGGLLQDEKQGNTRGIPLLQDLPWTGWLFQSKRDQSTKTQLIFFLRVHILPDAVPDAVRVHKPGSSLEEIGRNVELLNPNQEKSPSLKQVTQPVPDPAPRGPGAPAHVPGTPSGAPGDDAPPAPARQP